MMNKRNAFWFCALVMLLLGCDNKGASQPPEPPTEETIVFQSGFEDGVTVVETGLASCSGDIIGSDGSEHGDWVADLEAAASRSATQSPCSDPSEPMMSPEQLARPVSTTVTPSSKPD